MIRIELELDPPLKEFRKAWGKARKAGLTAAGELWIGRFLKRHFTFAGARRYGYKERAKWAESDPGRMRRLRSGRRADRRPLVHSGRLVGMATRSARVKVYGSMARIMMNAPGYVRYRGRSGTGPDLVAELTAVTDDEAQELAGAYAQGVGETLRRVRKKKVVK